MSISNNKYKILLDLTILEQYKAIPSMLIFKESYMIIKVQPQNKFNSKREMINSSLSPLYITKEEEILINYGLMRGVLFLDNSIKFEVYHPLHISPIIFIFYEFTTTTFFIKSSPLKQNQLRDIFNYMNGKKSFGSKKLIESLIFFLNSLKFGIEQDNLISIFYDKIVKSLTEAKNYFIQTINNLKTKDKLSQEYRNKIKFSNKICLNNNKIIVDNEINHQSVRNIEDIHNQFTREIKNVINNFESISQEIRQKSILYYERTTILFFQILGFSGINFNLEQKNISISQKLKNFREVPEVPYEDDASVCNFRMKNKEHIEYNNKHNSLEESKENNFDILLKNKIHSKYPVETPKFKMDHQKSDRSNFSIDNLKMISKNIEEVKKRHLFLPPNEFINILNNCIEISHRKFFEKCFDEYFKNVFSMEKDNLGHLKIECLVSYFFYLKGLKNFLFTDENKHYYSNLFFYENS